MTQLAKYVKEMRKQIVEHCHSTVSNPVRRKALGLPFEPGAAAAQVSVADDFLSIFCLDDIVGTPYKPVNFLIRNIAIQVELNPVTFIQIQRFAYRCPVHSNLIDFVGCGFYRHIREIVNIDQTKHMAEYIEYQNGVIATGKLPEGGLFRDAVHPQAIFPEILDIH